MTELDFEYVQSVVRAALAEDIGSGDITTQLTVPEDATSSAIILVKQAGVIAGLDVAESVFRAVDHDTECAKIVSDGAALSSGSQVARILGRTRSILTAERTALNFLQRMSGIATMTSRFVGLVQHTKAQIVDTRKTTPGLRALEKYAVRIGGGRNHRFGLYDGILIKDNHVKAAGGVRAALAAAKKGAHPGMRIEVEVESLEELEEAVAGGADAVLLDNMSPSVIRQAVKLAGDRVVLEASGGVSEATVKEIADTGVDLISIGALTHSAPALDISLEIT